jgi:ABC-type branched-subunit amino acid transport system substrate-binding protein
MQGLGKKIAALAVVAAAVAAVTAVSGFSAQQVSCNGTTPANAAKTSATYKGTVPAPNAKSKAYGQAKAGSCAYKGAGYFNLNLNKCPSDWNNTAGITKTSINLWTSMPHSGALAVYGGIGEGMKSYFNYVNSKGGIAGRKINLDIKDDALNPTITRKNADDAIQSNNYAASFAVLGTSNNLAIWDTMNKACMPQLMTASSDDQFGDVDTHPWTTMFGLDLYNETGLYINWLKSHYPNGGKIGVVQIDNGQGRVMIAGVKRAVKGTKFTIADIETHPGSAASIKDQITNLASTKADFFIVLEAGSFCSQALANLERTSWQPKATIVANSCAQISTVFQPLLSQGATGNGTRMIRYYTVPTDTDATSKTFAAFESATVKAAGQDPNDAQIANGWFWGWYVVQVLKDASVMKGGMSRANIVIAAHQYESAWPLMMPGVKAKTRGKIDAYPFESGQMYKYQGASGSTPGTFVKDGALIKNEGVLKNWANVLNG